MARKNHGHHGGAWKVAYADFVTAMMALFLVLWLTSQDTRIKQAVERTFKNPFATVTKESTGILPSTEAQAVKSTSGNWESASAVELTMLRRIAEDFVKILESNPEDTEEKPVQLEMTPEGVRISVFDRARKAIFHDNSAQFTDYGSWVFTTLAWELARFSGDFQIELEGHTERRDRDPAVPSDAWDLTSDRANSARHKILEHGVRPGQIQKVAGFADRQPINGAAPDDEANRRVTVMLKIRAGQRT